MRVWFSILAHDALTLLAALDSSPVAIAVVFPALRLFACTLAFGNKSRHPLESARMSKIGQLLSLEYLQLAVLLISTTIAFTSLAANPPLGEALAVHF